jgi:hypothetical protein
MLLARRDQLLLVQSTTSMIERFEYAIFDVGALGVTICDLV